MNKVDYYRWLARDMAEAKRRADINALDNKGCWEELEGILAEHQAELDSPTPPGRTDLACQRQTPMTSSTAGPSKRPAAGGFRADG